MSECDERMRPFRRRQSLEIGRAELGYDVMGVDARRRHRPFEPGNDARYLALRGGRACRDDRLAAFRTTRFRALS
jgi:hypothetical protein